MSFDALPIRPQRVAIIGGGISGLAAAYLLSPHHAVTLYEAAPRLGGHARTVMAGRNGDQPVDTGFIVFNYANYPHLTRMFQDLDVPVAKSDMSFGASINDGKIEYGLNSLSALLAQPRNMLRPGFSRMVRDILRFNKKADPFLMPRLCAECFFSMPPRLPNDVFFSKSPSPELFLTSNFIGMYEADLVDRVEWTED